MKGCTETELNDSRPMVEPSDTINFCLRKLYENKTKELKDEVVKGLTFEELIGALLQSKDAIQDDNDRFYNFPNSYRGCE